MFCARACSSSCSAAARSEVRLRSRRLQSLRLFCSAISVIRVPPEVIRPRTTGVAVVSSHLSGRIVGAAAVRSLGGGSLDLARAREGGGELGTRADLELAIRLAEAFLDGLARDEQRLRDFGVGEPLRGHARRLLLDRGERVE